MFWNIQFLLSYLNFYMNFYWQFVWPPSSSFMLRSNAEQNSLYLCLNGSYKIEQIIGEGASATPYIRLVRKAYRQRYGKEARPLSLVSTGVLPKLARTEGKTAQEIHAQIARDIAEYRPSLKKAPSLLLSEFTYSGNQLGKLSGALKVLAIPHKTAIMNPWITPGVDFYGHICEQGSLYLNLSGQYDFIDKTNPSKDLRNFELEGLDPKQIKITHYYRYLQEKKCHAAAQRRKENRFIMYCSAYFAPLREKKITQRYAIKWTSSEHTNSIGQINCHSK